MYIEQNACNVLVSEQHYKWLSATFLKPPRRYKILFMQDIVYAQK